MSVYFPRQYVDTIDTHKIVMKVPMNCRKCQTKALKIVAEENGTPTFKISFSITGIALQIDICCVSSVALGEKKDSVVVIGEGVDAIKLAKRLRKKFKTTDIVTVAEV
ncbi:hypothetical protein ACLB2K_024555 [Fragaria x ananassa]